MPACVCKHTFTGLSVFIISFGEDSTEHFPENCLYLFHNKEKESYVHVVQVSVQLKGLKNNLQSASHYK